MTDESHSHPAPAVANLPSSSDTGLGAVEVLVALAGHWKLLAAAPIAVGVVILGLTFLLPLTYTAQTVFIPPQQTQNAAASALASIGALAGIAGGSVKTPGDQYVSLLQSTNVEDRLVDQFKLMEVYEAKYRFIARRKLEQNTRIQLGKKDGLITIEVDAPDPKMAADMANQYVWELRRLSSQLSLTEAQQRRSFFEAELNRTKERLVEAQKTLQSGGFSPGAMKAEPKTAAETYARIQAELTAAEVRLQTLRQSHSDTSADVQQQLTMVSALRSQLSKLEVRSDNPGDADYLGRYREFKYQETLFELFSKQYELARLDESREGATIQVVDVATPPEYKSKPKRAFIAAGATVVTFILLAIGILGRHFWKLAKANPAHAQIFAQRRASLER